jgi:hypothetical protein
MRIELFAEKDLQKYIQNSGEKCCWIHAYKNCAQWNP